MEKQNETTSECRCSNASCCCQQSKTDRCSCSGGCGCKATCRCAGDCACGCAK